MAAVRLAVVMLIGSFSQPQGFDDTCTMVQKHAVEMDADGTAAAAQKPKVGSMQELTEDFSYLQDKVEELAHMTGQEGKDEIARTKVLNTKLKLMMDKINKAIDDMRGGMHDLAEGLAEGMKEASVKVAKQVTQSVQDSMHKEIEQSNSVEPFSLLEVRTDFEQLGGASVGGMFKARSALEKIHTSASQVLDHMQTIIGATSEALLHGNSGSAYSSEMNTKVEDMMTKTSAAIREMKSKVQDFAHKMASNLKQTKDEVAAQEHLNQDREGDGVSFNPFVS